MCLYVQWLKLSVMAASQPIPAARHMLRPQKRRRVAYAVGEPEAEPPASHADEEFVFAESTTGQSAYAPGIPFPETHTSAESSSIALANMQARMDRSDRVIADLMTMNTSLYRTQRINAEYMDHLSYVQRRTLKILSLLSTQADAPVAVLVDDEHGYEATRPDAIGASRTHRAAPSKR
jgi:hypothetical protein